MRIERAVAILLALAATVGGGVGLEGVTTRGSDASFFLQFAGSIHATECAGNWGTCADACGLFLRGFR
jgi:hypothetical protein